MDEVTGCVIVLCTFLVCATVVLVTAMVKGYIWHCGEEEEE